VVCWDVIAEDWRDDPPEALAKRVYRRLRRGSIVLFHDTLYTTVEEDWKDRRPMRAAVEQLLVDLKDYRFVTVPDLLELGRPPLALVPTGAAGLAGAGAVARFPAA
jgi:peptidoglycan/xylan/chitin deacetylase (PgdA/CDA1 family)